MEDTRKDLFRNMRRVNRRMGDIIEELEDLPEGADQQAADLRQEFTMLQIAFAELIERRGRLVEAL